MDILSQLLSLARVHVDLDVRCLLSGKFDVPHEQLPAGQAAFHFLLSGQCSLQLGNGQVVTLTRGDFVLLSKGHAHAIVNSGVSAGESLPVRVQYEGLLPLKHNRIENDSAAADLLCGHYDYSPGAGSLFTRWLPDVLHSALLHTANWSTLQTLIELLRTEATGTPQPGAYAIVDSLGQILLSLALRLHAQSEHNTTGLLPLISDARLGPSVHAMLNDPGQPWTIETLGNIAAMSRATYARHFQTKAGFSVGEFLTQIRMAHACMHIEQGKLSLTEIADKVGYGSGAAFGKAFRHVMGETPGRWQRALKV